MPSGKPSGGVKTTLRGDPPYLAAFAWARDHGYRGSELPRGTIGDDHLCPLGRATGWRIDLGVAELEGHRESLPPLVTRFTKLFDTGQYPQLLS
jgi:hypothetical protein